MQSPTAERGKREPNLKIDRIQPDDSQSVADYYGFEVEHGFSSVHPQDTFENMVSFRQRQIRDGELAVAMIREGGKVVATSVVVLKEGAMGKHIAPNEAYAAGTLVSPSLRGRGIGEQLSATQDTIAREAGKESIVTIVQDTNLPSLRLRLKVGYRMEGVVRQPDGEIDFTLRRNLVNTPSEKKSLQAEWQAGLLPIVNDMSATNPEQMLVDPQNVELIEHAIAQGYKGVYLLRPGDFPDAPELSTDMIVFTKAEILSDTR